MSDRSKKLVARVQRFLFVKNIEINKAEIYDALQQAQVQILTETLCLSETKTIQLVASQEEYPITIGIDGRPIILKAISLIRPDGLSITLLDDKQYNFLRKNEGTLSANNSPLIAKLNGNTISLFPIPANPIETDLMTLTFYKGNTNADITETIEPELPVYWDKAIETYAIFSLTYDPNALEIYSREIITHKNHSFTNGSNNNRIKANW